MFLKRFTVGPLMQNAYLLADETTNDAVFIDPGDEAALLMQALSDAGLTLKAIWLTHAHFDHVGAVADLKARFGAPVYLHPLDTPLLKNAAASAAKWGIDLKQPPPADHPIADHQVLEVGSLKAEALFTPGHAPGHVAFYLPEAATVLSGDALFQGSIGRTDLPYGDHQRLLESIKTRLLTLPPQTVVLPGHGPETTVAAEAETNPFLI